MAAIRECAQKRGADHALGLLAKCRLALALALAALALAAGVTVRCGASQHNSYLPCSGVSGSGYQKRAFRDDVHKRSS